MATVLNISKIGLLGLRESKLVIEWVHLEHVQRFCRTL